MFFFFKLSWLSSTFILPFRFYSHLVKFHFQKAMEILISIIIYFRLILRELPTLWYFSSNSGLVLCPLLFCFFFSKKYLASHVILFLHLFWNKSFHLAQLYFLLLLSVRTLVFVCLKLCFPPYFWTIVLYFMCILFFRLLFFLCMLTLVLFCLCS